MESYSVSGTLRQPLADTQSINDNDEQQPRVKDENDADSSVENDEDAYKPRPQLSEPIVCMRTLADLINYLEKELIDISPEYQRDVVWTADRMTGLVDSLMENFYIPPIILNKKKSKDKNKPAMLICVDGKQRLSSIRAFVKGVIPCHDHRGEKWWFCGNTNDSRRKKVLPEDAQRIFLRKELVSFEFNDLLPDQEEDLFARVQMGVQLSPAEKMRASTGPWQELAKLYIQDFPRVYSLMKDRSRAKDFQLTLACFSQIVEVMKPTALDGTPMLKSTHGNLPRLLGNKDLVDDGLKSHLASVWSTFDDLLEMDSATFTNSSKYLRGVQTFAPIEMIAVTVLISVHSGTRNKQILLGDIRFLREALRENFTDIKQNKKEWSFIWGYLKDLEAIRAVGGRIVNRRLQQSGDDTSTLEIQSQPTTNGNSVERREEVTAGMPDILPSQQSFTIKKENGLSDDSLEQPQPKRQRTDPISPGSPMSEVEQHGAFRATTHHATQHFDHLGAIRQHDRTPTEGNMSTPSGMAQQSWSNISAISGSQSPHISADIKQDPDGFSDTQASRQIPEVNTNTYKAPIVPMMTTAPVMSMQQAPTVHVRTKRPSLTTSSAPWNGIDSSPFTPTIRSTNVGTSRGAYSSTYTEKQWAGQVRSVSPLGKSTTLSSSQRLKGQIPRKAPPPLMAAQLDDVIDLTSDTEQERQELLSTFKATALASRAKQFPQ